MSEPLSLVEQMNRTNFIPTKTLLVLLDLTDYDAVWHDNNGNPKQQMTDVPQASKDCEDMKVAFRRFGVKQDDIVEFPDKTLKGIKATYKKKVADRLGEGKRTRPRTNYAVVHVLAGHGVLFQGFSALCLPEYDPKTSWYRLFLAE